MNRILLTGANGFIGRQCIPLLQEVGFEIHALTPDNKKIYGTDGIYWHVGDLFDRDRIAGLITEIQATHLLHLAWFTEPGIYWDDERNLNWVEVSLKLVRSFAEAGGKRLVLAGSCAEYDWNYGYCSESITPLRPATLYGTCKNSLNQIVDRYAQLSGLRYTWGRIFYLYGPYENEQRLVPYIIRSLLEHKVAECTHGNQVRDFLHVTDVARAFVSLIRSDVEGPVNIASGIPVTLREIIYMIGNKLGRSHLCNLGIKPVHKNDPPLLVADVRRLRDEVKWEPSITLDWGINQTIEWWEKKSIRIKENE
jgi:nucleoside-diphosphate-sugar epimerase